MKEQQCLNCGLFNLLSRHTCEYCGSPDLKVIQTSTKPIAELVANADEFAELGPAFMQCGKITKLIPDGAELCQKPMYHAGDCK